MMMTLKFKRRIQVPVLTQLSGVECGAACLAMILSYFGRDTKVSECRERLAIGRDGVNAYLLAQAARNYGLRVRAYSIEPDKMSHMQLPAIAHWNFNHFIVVEKWGKRHVDIIDPAIGRRRISLQEFDESFTGVILTFEVGAQFEPRKVQRFTTWWHYIRAILGSVPGTPAFLLQLFFASLLIQLSALVFPVFTRILVDDILPVQLTDGLAVMGIGLLVLLLAYSAFQFLRFKLAIYLQSRLDSQMMINFFDHLLTLPFSFFQQRTSGDLIMRLSSNAMMREVLTNQTLTIVLDSIFVVVYLVAIFVAAPLIGWITLCLGIVQLLIILLPRQRLQHLMSEDLAAQASSQSYLVEALTGIGTLKALGIENHVVDQWSTLFFKQLNISVRRNYLASSVNTAMSIISVFSPMLLLWVMAHLVIEGSMTLGTMLALNALAAAFLSPLASLLAASQQLQLIGSYFERIIDVIEAEPEQDISQVRHAPVLTGKIDLHDVTFAYTEESKPVLQDISLSIEAGQKVALVGATGSGKSTLGMLLLGMYRPTKGQICFDDIPLEELEYRSVRGQMGVVLQEPFLFSGSIRKNISSNDLTIPMERVIQAAALAVIHHDIVQMPMGYETRIAENGGGLSGGQRQRLALARALARQPAILLLDEATSHLDVVTEDVVDTNLSQLPLTRVVIAHRLSTVENADHIVVLHDGRIVEQGTHDELLAANNYYSRLIHKQLEEGLLTL